MARRAPSGTREVLARVARTANKYGDEKAAKAFHVSERRVSQIRNAIDKGKPLGSIVRSSRGLEAWKERTTHIRSRVRAAELPERFKGKQIAKATEKSESTARRLLQRVTRTGGTPEDRAELRAAEKKLSSLEPEKIEIKINEQTTIQVMLYKSADQFPEHNEKRNTFGSLAEAKEYVKTIGAGAKFFFIYHNVEEDYYEVYIDEDAAT
jgi:transposase